ncbi:hypothetical protein M408DRAFT_29361 [Serendipita vermifera MAFF 305830]|uniref:TOG domain-containing protein n=1 Tax=Serendipita vermifera MAFF 305830 TaxID=933852 RepID=A0A0C3AQY1_SERVB|nr:hypothetical protein M408DRAFT_29361 [Serendipita vermifera MAFF 305830]
MPNKRIHAIFSAQELRPLEIWTQCIFEACRGPNYMAELLILTTVSNKWKEALMRIQTLWAYIKVTELDEDSEATVALFLHLSGKARLSLTISMPLSGYWNNISSLLLPHNARIRIISFISNEDESQMLNWQYRDTDRSVDAEAGRVLKHVILTLDLFKTMKRFEVTSDIPVRPDVLLPSPAQLSIGNWLIQSASLGGISFKEKHQSFLQPRHLIMGATDLLDFGRYSSMLGHLKHLSLHSETREYIESPPTYLDPTASFRVPFLTTLHYHARFQPALSRLLISTQSTLKFLNIEIGILDIADVIHALRIAMSLRCLTLTLLILEYDQDSRGKKRTYYPMTIVHTISKQRPPSWRLANMEIFKCEIKHFEGNQIPESLNVDYLWKIFHSIFPNLRHLVWNLPMQSRTQLLSLTRQNQLTYFETTAAPAPSYHHGAGAVLSQLESLTVNDVRIFSNMPISNLKHLSMKWSDELEIPVGISLVRLESLTLTIGNAVNRPVELNSEVFSSLKLISMTFHGSKSAFELPNLPNIIEIRISTRSPALTQGMKLCVSLIREPEICPKLEKVHLDSFIQWDILFVLLKRRNLGQNSAISRIRELKLPHVAPRFRPVLTSLLKGQQALPDLAFYRMLEELSIWQAQRRLLDENITGCVYCVCVGTSGCHEPVHTARFPSEHGNMAEWGPSSTTPIICSNHDQEWMEKYTGDVLMWTFMAQEWSKLHHRTLMCHKRPSTKIIISDQDTSVGESLRGIDLESQLTGLESFMRGCAGTPYENNTTEELMDIVRSCLSASRWGLVHNANPRYAALLSNPRFFASFMDRQSVTGRAVALAFKRLVENDAFRTALLLHIAGMLMSDKYDVRETGATVMVEFTQHTELLYETNDIISGIFSNIAGDDIEVQTASLRALSELFAVGLCRLIDQQIFQIVDMLKDEKEHVQSGAAETLRRLATHARLHPVIRENFPRVLDILQNEKYDVQSNVVSALTKCAEHAELHSFITLSISRVGEMLKVKHSHVGPIVDTLAGLARHAEFCYPISSATLQVVERLTDEDEEVRSHGFNVLTKLAKHPEFDNSIASTIPQIANMLKDEKDGTRSSAVAVLEQLAKFDRFTNSIVSAIPQIVNMLKDENDGVRSSAVPVITRLAKFDSFDNLTLSAIPQIVNMLKDENDGVRSSAVAVITRLAKFDSFDNLTLSAIPQIVNMLKDENDGVRSSAVPVITRLAKFDSFDNLTLSAIPQIVNMLKDENDGVRSSAVAVVTRLAKSDRFTNSIVSAIPQIVNMLKGENDDERSSAVAVLEQLAKFACEIW